MDTGEGVTMVNYFKIGRLSSQNSIPKASPICSLTSSLIMGLQYPM